MLTAVGGHPITEGAFVDSELLCHSGDAGMKVAFAKLAQAISGFDIELHAESGLQYDDWTMRRTEVVDLIGREPGYRYLRARGNSIEGGTSEILRNTISERILGLPGEHRVDKDIAWKDLNR